MDRSRAVYGIDLGTTYSCIAQVDNFDQAIVIRNYEGDSTIPSAVYFEDKDNITIGKEAKGMLAVEPEKTVVFVKREMGIDESFDKRRNQFPYHFDPSEISAFILKKLVNDANEINNVSIKDVVITCPAYFGTKERLQTKQAGIIAGLNVISIINEPTAAAISYGAKLDSKKTFLVYDLGGGTFDVTLLNVNQGAIKVIATGGDHHLGGVDWDTQIAKYLLAAFNNSNGTSYNLDDDPILKNTLLLDAEQKKKLLTAKDSVMWNFSYKGKDLRMEFTRNQFDEITRSLLDSTIDYMRSLLDTAYKKGYRSFDEILLVGGSSRMPQIKERIDKEFNCNARFNDPDESVAKGAAIFAMNELYTQSLARYEKGEAISSSIFLKGEAPERPKPITGDRVSVVNVTSKTYGLSFTEAKSGNEMVENFIFANTSLPYHVEINDLVTLVDNQIIIELPIFESDFVDPDKDKYVDPKFCILIDKHKLSLSRPRHKNTPLSVSFTIDKEGILNCHATCKGDELSFQLQLKGVKSQSELNTSREIIGSKNIQ
jgi:molecular chaperone DnaK